MYIKGKVISIQDNLIRIRNLKYPDIVVTINRDSQMDEVVLQYLPPLDKIKLGTKIIGKNGGFAKVEEIPQHHILRTM